MLNYAPGHEAIEDVGDVPPLILKLDSRGEYTGSIAYPTIGFRHVSLGPLSHKFLESHLRPGHGRHIVVM